MSKILIIDDSELVSKLLYDTLSEAGYTALQAMDANQGYQVAREWHPDLILLDVHLPDAIGFDLLNVFKNDAALKNVPIVMITGSHQQQAHKELAFSKGVVDYIFKPFDMGTLVQRLQPFLGHSGASPSAAPAAIPQLSQPYSTTKPLMGRNSALNRFPLPPGTTKAPQVESPRPEFATKPFFETEPQAPVHSEMEAPPMPLMEAVKTILLSPQAFRFEAPLPRTTLAFICTALALGLTGLSAAAGPAVKPAVLALVLPLGWVALVSVLVMSASVMGISLVWKEGAQLLSLAMTPLLLKLAGGLVVALWTSLSPFYFTAGPALLMKAPSVWMMRADLFEIWGYALLAWMVGHRPGAKPKTVLIVVALTWLAGAALAAGLGKIG